MKIKKLMILLLSGVILSIVMATGCKKDDEVSLDNPDYAENKGEFKDSRDDKVYKWVKIGEQIWMAENLAYTGSGIQHITDANAWINNSSFDAWCYYDNKKNYSTTYGVLYQFDAAIKSCPKGWHLPTNLEWTQLKDYLIENGYSYDGVVGNNGIAKSLANNSGWSISGNQGAIGNSDFSSIRNKTGFSALPGGCRGFNYNTGFHGCFIELGKSCCWWSKTENNENSLDRADTWKMDYDGVELYKVAHRMTHGISVRCIKD